MPISPGQAAAALEEVEQTERRTRLSGGYAAASPHLILWGLIWIAGYGGCAVTPPERWGLVWLPLAAAGIAGSSYFSRRRPARAGGGAGEGGRSALMGL